MSTYSVWRLQKEEGLHMWSPDRSSILGGAGSQVRGSVGLQRGISSGKYNL